MKIYTKGGDKGLTSLWGGKRVSKASERINAYGTIDELNVAVGMVRDVCNDDAIEELLIRIQNQLFTIGSYLAADPDKKGLKLPDFDAAESIVLEQAIDEMDRSLPQLKNFVLPGGHLHVSFCHQARVICRRAERYVVALNDDNQVNPDIIIYLNRLSDYLFVLSRKIAHTLGANEVPWKP